MTTTNPLNVALLQAKTLASSFSDRNGLVDVSAVARSLGVESIEATTMSADGYLGRQADGNLIIRYRTQNSDRRNRFTVAHEIAHLLLAQAHGKDLRSDPAYRSRDHLEELAVNRIAAELLMPEHIVVQELRAREERMDMPSWRVICALRYRLAVSESAIALRMLEIRGLYAVLFRINIEGQGPHYPFDRSEGAHMSLVHAEEFDAERLWREARRSNRHAVPIRVGRTKLEIRCEGLLRSIKTRRGLTRQYWVLGWEFVNQRRVPTLI